MRSKQFQKIHHPSISNQMKIRQLSLLILLTQLAFAQDTHYWNVQYGMRGSILGNAIMSHVRDNSAIYYNPACLSLIDSNNISVSASLYQYDMTDMPNGAGDGIDMKRLFFIE
jgi:hypothetical protein